MNPCTPSHLEWCDWTEEYRVVRGTPDCWAGLSPDGTDADLYELLGPYAPAQWGSCT